MFLNQMNSVVKGLIHQRSVLLSDTIVDWFSIWKWEIMDASPSAEHAVQSFFNGTEWTNIVELWKRVNLMDSCSCHLCCDILWYFSWDTENRRMVVAVNSDDRTLVTNSCTITWDSCNDIHKLRILRRDCQWSGLSVDCTSMPIVELKAWKFGIVFGRLFGIPYVANWWSKGKEDEIYTCMRFVSGIDTL